MMYKNSLSAKFLLLTFFISVFVITSCFNKTNTAIEPITINYQLSIQPDSSDKVINLWLESFFNQKSYSKKLIEKQVNHYILEANTLMNYHSNIAQLTTQLPVNFRLEIRIENSNLLITFSDYTVMNTQRSENITDQYSNSAMKDYFAAISRDLIQKLN